jgi:hypothetical protein
MAPGVNSASTQATTTCAFATLNQLVLLSLQHSDKYVLKMTFFFVINIILISTSTLKVVCTVTVHQTRDIKVLAVKPGQTAAYGS